MIEKRFTINNNMDFNDKIETYELNCISDNENKTFYFIADSLDNVQLFVKRLNELHEENQRLIKMLDNVANYMQKQHKDMSIDDFVEWWNNIATEGLEND